MRPRTVPVEPGFSDAGRAVHHVGNHADGNHGATKMIQVNYYDSTATKIVRVGSYRTRDLAAAAIRRAQRKGRIAILAGIRTANDQPTAHH